MILNIKNFLFVILIIFFSSCQKNNLYTSTIKFNDSKWERIEKGRVVNFKDIKIKDTEDVYDIKLTFRHTKQINTDNINFVLTITSPSGISKETIQEIELKDRNKEKFLGNDLGDIVETSKIIKQYATMPEKGEYTISIANYSSVYQITGLESITLEINKSNLDYKTDK
ncbi:MAG: gliding motility lipoprotein GldH [Bacteroidales bacterium]|nr:gliding motility lipoprotein GldH [Bacteroidales bacterium]